MIYLISLFQMLALWLVTPVGVNASVHPFHVSVTEINENSSTHRLEIDCRVFPDDLENEMSVLKSKVDIENKEKYTENKTAICAYISTHLLIDVNNKPVKFTCLGYEMDKDGLHIYLESEEVEAVKTLKVENNFLHRIFNDQINIVYFYTGGKRYPLKLNNGNRSETISIVEGETKNNG